MNLGSLDAALESGKVDAAQPITEAVLRDAGLVRLGKVDGVRLLAKGSISRAINIEVSGASVAAISAVEQAGRQREDLGASKNPGSARGL